MRHTKLAAVVAVAAASMSAAVAHAVGGPTDHGQTATTHGQSGQTHGNDGTNGNDGTHGPKAPHGQNGTHGPNGTRGPKGPHHTRANNTHSQGCHFHKVAWVAKGVLLDTGPTFQALGDGKFDVGDMSIQFTGGNHFAKGLGTIPQPLDLSNVRVVFALSDLQPLDGVVDQSDVQAGDRVQLIGKILWRPARCEPPVTETQATTNAGTTDTGTTGTDTTGISATPAEPTEPQPIVRKVIFKDPSSSGTQATTTQTETETQTTTAP